MKFTMSEDGICRANIRVTLRLSQEEIATLKEKAKLEGVSWRDILEREASQGIDLALIEDDSNYFQRYGKGDG